MRTPWRVLSLISSNAVRTGPTVKPPEASSTRGVRTAVPTHVRYNVLLLTFCITFMMYLDRAVMGSATPAIMSEFHVTKIGMGWSTSAFNWSYALFQVPGGWLADRYGPRLVLTCALAWWSIFTSATGLAYNAISLAIARFCFGVGEAAAFPSSSRALLRWLPANQRAFGQGFQHAGSRFGAALAPLIVLLLIARFNWQSIFFILGATGVLWSIAWYFYYRNDPREHAAVNAAEVDLIGVGSQLKVHAGKGPVPWACILASHDLWYLSAMYFCYGWVLWLYLQWLPTYFIEARHFTAIKTGLATSVPLLAATVTNVAGGWISDKLAHRWSDLRRGRTRVSVIGFAIAGLALIPGVLVQNNVISLAWITIALAGLELTVAVSWAICLDIGGEFTGSVSAVMNMLGNIGGAIAAVVIGYLSTLLGWNWPFLTASVLCMIAGLLATRIDPQRSAVSERAK
jgi:MFS family permease